MSQISNVSSHEEAESDSGESDHSASSHSLCNSSNSVLATAVLTEQDKEASTSLETAWTDSKHSSYLDFMEANFVKNMFGSSYCAEDVCGKTSSQHRQCVDNDEEYDDDSAQSQLHMPYETMEFKMCDRGDWTLRPVSRLMAPAGIPWGLLTNPWVKHFQPKNSSTIPSTPSSSRKGEVRSIVSFSRKPEIGSVEHLQRINASAEVASSSNPVDAGIPNTKKRALKSTDKQEPLSRQKIDNEVKSDGSGTINQEHTFPPNVIVQESA